MKKNILFICKWNRFRSKVAEAFFKKYNGNPNYKAKSAGLIKGSPIKPSPVIKEFGIKIKGPTNGISTKLLKWHNVMIIVADDVPKSLFKDNKKFGKKLIVWEIPDAETDDDKEIRKIVKRIERKVKKIVKNLKC